ncbi:hypothetical protein ACPA9J_00345 [Pseudomonas aeruginosa]
MFYDGDACLGGGVIGKRRKPGISEDARRAIRDSN